MSPVDLDGTSTVRPHPAVAAAVRHWIEHQAHPGAAHGAGAAARHAIESARAEVAALFGADPRGVVFTSGATEANNQAIRGHVQRLRGSGFPVVAVAAHETASLLHPARSAGGERALVVPVGRDGILDPARIASARRGLIVCAHAHAEAGTLQPVFEIGEAARRIGARVHVDVSLTAGRIPADFASVGHPDSLSVSFHLLGGPMGIGALLLREDFELPPWITGGPEEDGRRAGSPNLAGIAGAGVAAALARQELASRTEALRGAADSLARAVFAVDGIRPTGPPLHARLPGHLSLLVEGVDGEAMVVALDDRGVLASTGSPCGLEAGMRSAALRAAGFTPDEARTALVLCASPVGVPDSGALRVAERAVAESARALRGIAGSVAPPEG